MVGDERFCGVFRDNDLLVRELWLIELCCEREGRCFGWVLRFCVAGVR